jgi:hypothetical protein
LHAFYTIPQIFEAGSCVTGFIYLKKIKKTYWKWFLFYLLFITIADFTGNFLTRDVNKVFFNDFVIPVEFLFFYWLFHHAFKNSKYRLLPLACTIVYVIGWLIDKVLISSQDLWFYSFSYTIANLLLLILILCSFMRLITSNAILSFRSNMLFWVSLGLLLFYLGTFPFFGLYNPILTDKNLVNIKIFYSYMLIVFNCLMYFMFAVSFIWGKPESKYSSL